MTALNLLSNPITVEALSPDRAVEALMTVPKTTRVQLAPQAATSVPLTQDVHGERVVFGKTYGNVVEPVLDQVRKRVSKLVGG